MYDGLPHPSETSRLLVSFDVRPVKDEEASLKEGRPVYVDTEYVRIQTPGDNTSIVHRPATDADRRQYARIYEAFKQAKAAPETGTPLTEWPPVSRSEVEELAYHGVKTVEQLAGVSDSNIDSLGLGGRRLRAKAQKFIEDAKVSAPSQQHAADMASLENQNAALMARLDALAAELARVTGKPVAPVEIEAPKPKRRGRPPKAKAEASKEG